MSLFNEKSIVDQSQSQPPNLNDEPKKWHIKVWILLSILLISILFFLVTINNKAAEDGSIESGSVVYSMTLLEKTAIKKASYTGGETQTILEDSDAYRIIQNPTRDLVAFYKADNTINILDSNSNAIQQIDQSLKPVREIPSPRWSADGRYLVYAKSLIEIPEDMKQCTKETWREYGDGGASLLPDESACWLNVEYHVYDTEIQSNIFTSLPMPTAILSFDPSGRYLFMNTRHYQESDNLRDDGKYYLYFYLVDLIAGEIKEIYKADTNFDHRFFSTTFDDEGNVYLVDPFNRTEKGKLLFSYNYLSGEFFDNKPNDDNLFSLVSPSGKYTFNEIDSENDNDHIIIRDKEGRVVIRTETAFGNFLGWSKDEKYILVTTSKVFEDDREEFWLTSVDIKTGERTLIDITSVRELPLFTD